MTTEKIDTRPYTVDLFGRPDVERCVICYEPIWLPHRDDCVWRLYFPELEREPEWVTDIVVVFALVFAAWMLGQIVAGFIA